MSYVTLELAKKHILVDLSFTDDDAYITQLINASERIVERYLDKPLLELEDESGNLPEDTIQAILLTIANLYASREPVSFGASPQKVPLGLEYILDLQRKHSVG